MIGLKGHLLLSLLIRLYYRKVDQTYVNTYNSVVWQKHCYSIHPREILNNNLQFKINAYEVEMFQFYFFLPDTWCLNLCISQYWVLIQYQPIKNNSLHVSFDFL